MAAPHASAAGAWDVSQLDNPCRVLRQQEVARVLATPVGAPRKLDSWPPVCAFTLTATVPDLGPVPPDAKPSTQAEYFYVIDDSAASGKEDFERGRSNKAAVQPVAGIGDEAYWTPDKAELQIMSGRTHLITKFGGPTPPAKAMAKAIALARIALPRAKPAA
jgi:hypothetical protein